MKLLWLCNIAPSAVQEKISGCRSGGLWMDHVLSGLRQQKLIIRILFPGAAQGTVDEDCSYSGFSEGLPYQYLPELETQFGKELNDFAPDVIHIWGTEYGHTLAMVNAAERAGMLSRVVVSIQGLCSVIARHYAEGVPHNVQNRSTFRDFIRRDNIARQQKKFFLRGELETKALQKVEHIIGRTHWDEACTKQIHPQAAYHFCSETLREEFYADSWRYDSCQKHRIFASSCSYPVKGFHYVLEAFADVVRNYPDARLSVTGDSYLNLSGKQKLRQESYQKYLADLTYKYGLEEKIDFLGALDAEQMKQAYLDANVFVLPSTIENSPNSLGEAMLLGVPCVAADVGGVSTMMHHPDEGLTYQSTAPYMLAHFISRIFAMEEQAEKMGVAGRTHALQTHDPEKNLDDLLNIYRQIAK